MSSSTVANEKRKLNALAGFKFLAMLCIVWWHLSFVGLPGTDLGARMCEFLFVASGFLIAYNYFYKDVDDSRKTSIAYVLKKITHIWPLHILTMLAVLAIDFKVYLQDWKFAGVNLIINSSLMQSWFNNQKVFWGFNTVSWFISSLLFCYFLAPFFLKFTKKIKTSSILFVMVFIVRLSLEFLTVKNTRLEIYLNIHIFPIVRCLEFFMGMLIVPVFMFLLQKVNKLKNKHKNICFVVFSALEIFSVIIVSLLLIKSHNEWLRAWYVLLFCGFVFILAFDEGVFAKIFSLKIFQMIFALQFEIYLFQIVVNKYFNKIMYKWFPKLQNFLNLYVLIIFIVLFTVSWLYHKYLNKPLSKLTTKLCNFIMKIFGFKYRI